MNLKEELLRGIYAYGFEKPSAIQQRAILPCVKGLDVIAQAQSGKHFLEIPCEFSILFILLRKQQKNPAFFVFFYSGNSRIGNY